MKTHPHKNRNNSDFWKLVVIFIFFWLKLVFNPSHANWQFQSFSRFPIWERRPWPTQSHFCSLWWWKRRASPGAALDAGTRSYPTPAPSRPGWQTGYKTLWQTDKSLSSCSRKVVIMPQNDGRKPGHSILWLRPQSPAKTQYLIQEKESMDGVPRSLAGKRFLHAWKILKTQSSHKKEMEILFLDINYKYTFALDWFHLDLL